MEIFLKIISFKFDDSSCVKPQDMDKELCEGVYSKEETILIEEQQNFEMANYICQSFGGQFPVPKNEAEHTELFRAFKTELHLFF